MQTTIFFQPSGPQVADFFRLQSCATFSAEAGKTSAPRAATSRTSRTNRTPVHTHNTVESAAEELLVFVVHRDDDEQLGLAVVERRAERVALVVEFVWPAGHRRVPSRDKLVRIFAREETEETGGDRAGDDEVALGELDAALLDVPAASVCSLWIHQAEQSVSHPADTGQDSDSRNS